MLACGAVLLALKCAFVVWTPLRALTMSAWFIDDSYITMRVARNVGLGLGFSFDGVHPTTGVSPLWTYITALPHVFFGHEAAAKLTILASTVFGGIAGLLTYVIAKKWTGQTAVAWISFALVSLMPVQFFNALNGMETAFFTSLLLAGFALFLHQEDARNPVRHGLLAGSFFGLALLTRADAIFAIAALYCIGAVTCWLQPTERRRIILWLGGATAAVLCCFALLLVWQWLQSGSWHPDNQVGRRYIAMAKHGFSFSDFSLAYYLKIVTWNSFELEQLWTYGLGSGLLGLLGLLHAMFVERKATAFAWMIALYVGLFSFVLVAYQWYFPDFHGLRYINAGTHLVLICVAALLWSVFRSTYARTIGLGALCAALLVLSWYHYFDLARRPLWAQEMGLFGQSSAEKQERFWGTIDCMNANLAEDASIAARDHGRIAYFTDRQIQDMAGILDPDILQAYETNTIAEYLRKRDIDYVFLPDPQEGATNIYQAFHDSLELEAFSVCPPRTDSEYRLYEIQ